MAYGLSLHYFTPLGRSKSPMIEQACSQVSVTESALHGHVMARR